jgi:hypothetical protein
VLYDVKKKDNAGEKWVKDLRTWWRKAGRDVKLPIDGVSGATRAAGVQTLNFAPAKAGLDKLPAGDYKLVIEARAKPAAANWCACPSPGRPRASSPPGFRARKNWARCRSPSNKETPCNQD